MRGLISRPSHIFLICMIFFVQSSKGQEPSYRPKGREYPLTPFPFLDTLNVIQAFNNRFYLKFLLKCVFFEGHCDIIGKWLKPRAMAGIFGKCLGCTEFQKEHLNEWLELLIDQNPQEFRAAMVKVCVDLELPPYRTWKLEGGMEYSRFLSNVETCRASFGLIEISLSGNG